MAGGTKGRWRGGPGASEVARKGAAVAPHPSPFAPPGDPAARRQAEPGEWGDRAACGPRGQVVAGGGRMRSRITGGLQERGDRLGSTPGSQE